LVKGFIANDNARAEQLVTTVLPLITSADDTVRAHGNLQLRELLRPGVSGAVTSGTIKAALAVGLVNKLSDEQLAHLEPPTAAGLMLALQRCSEYKVLDPLNQSVSNFADQFAFASTGAFDSPRNARYWSLQSASGPQNDDEVKAVARLRDKGPRSLSYVDNQLHRLAAIHYAPNS
jgi:hypothetical protein